MKAWLLKGDVRKRLRDIKPKSVQCIVTSPPYFGLKDYEVDGQLGLERRASEYISSLVGVFKLCLDALADDGVMFINLGDSYASYVDGSVPPQSTSGAISGRVRVEAANRMKKYLMLDGFKRKELMGIPWRFALEMQKLCYLRQEIIWSKTAYTPERVLDRFVKSHEHIFMFTKRDMYKFDGRRVMIPSEGGLKLRNTVWNVAPSKFRGAHFATYPMELIEPMIQGGSNVGDIVLDPFNGSGTTGMVALKHQRNYIGIDLNSKFIEIAEDRILNDKYVGGSYTSSRKWLKSKSYRNARFLGSSCKKLTAATTATKPPNKKKRRK